MLQCQTTNQMNYSQTRVVNAYRLLNRSSFLKGTDRTKSPRNVVFVRSCGGTQESVIVSSPLSLQILVLRTHKSLG